MNAPNEKNVLELDQQYQENRLHKVRFVPLLNKETSVEVEFGKNVPYSTSFMENVSEDVYKICKK